MLYHKYKLVLGKVSLQDGNGEVKSYLVDGWILHCLNISGTIFLCMTEANGGKRIPFIFLQTIKECALKQYSLSILQNSVEYELNREFSPVLKDHITRINNGEADNLQILSSEIEKVKDNMVQNIDSLLERGEHVELLVEKSESLNQGVFRFNVEAKRLSKMMRRRKSFVYAAFAIGTLTSLALIVTTIVCGGITYRECR